MFFHPEFNNYHPPELEYKINQEYLHELEEINSDKERYFLYLLFKEEKIKERPREVYLKIFKNCPHSIINHIGLDIIKNDLFLDEFYEVIFSLEVNILLLNEITLNLLVKFNGKFKWEKVVQLEFEWLKKFVLLRNFVFYAFTNFYENFDELYKINLTNMNDIEIVEKDTFGSKIILFSDLYFSFAYEILELNWENCDFLFIFFFTNPRKQILNEKINQNNFIYLLELYSYTEFFYDFIQRNLNFVYFSVKNIKKTAELINLYTNSKVKFVSQESFIEFVFKEKNKKEEFHANNKNLFEGQSINQEEIENLNKFCKEIYMLTSKNNINEYLLLISLVKNLYYSFFDNLFLNFLSSSNISIYATFLSNSDKFIPVRKVQKYLSKIELFNLFKEFFKNVRSTDFTSKEKCFIRKNELDLTSFDEVCELKTCDPEENSGEQSFNSIFDSRLNFKKIYQNFSNQKNSDVLTKHIKEFLALILKSSDPDFIYLLPLVPYIPPEHETYLLIYKIYILLFQYDLPDLILFNIKTPALLVSNIITIQDDTLIDNLSKITFKFNCFDIFENNSTILFLGVIYYSELAKLNNFNYSGILNYIMDSTMINLLKNNLILIIKCVHEECMFENKSFNKKYAEEIIDLLLSKYLSTEEEVWHTSEKILIIILRILVNKDIDLIYNVKIHKSISYIIKNANQNDLLGDYISLYVNILQKMKNTPNFLNYVILFISDYKYFYRYIIPLESKSFDKLVSKTKEFSKKIKEFSSTKDIVTLYQEYKDDSLDWFIDLFYLKKESIFTAISLLKVRYLINYDFNDLFLLLYFLDYQENYEFYAYLYVIKRKRSIFNTSLKCKGMFKYYFLSKKSKSNSF